MSINLTLRSAKNSALGSGLDRLAELSFWAAAPEAIEMSRTTLTSAFREEAQRSSFSPTGVIPGLWPALSIDQAKSQARGCPSDRTVSGTKFHFFADFSLLFASIGVNWRFNSLRSKITLITPQKSLCSRLPECRVYGHSERLRNES